MFQSKTQCLSFFLSLNFFRAPVIFQMCLSFNSAAHSFSTSFNNSYFSRFNLIHLPAFVLSIEINGYLISVDRYCHLKFLSNKLVLNLTNTYVLSSCINYFNTFSCHAFFVVARMKVVCSRSTAAACHSKLPLVSHMPSFSLIDS